LDGVYVLRTSLPEDVLGRDGVVSSYKELENVERAFRGLGPELDVRPLHHRLADRARAHVFLRMLSYHVAWHMKGALAPVLFKDDDKAAARAARPRPVAPAQRSAKALRKIARKRTDDGWPEYSSEALLADLGTICVNTVPQLTAPSQRSRRSLCRPPSSDAPSSCSASPTTPGTPRRQRLLTSQPNPQVDDLGFVQAGGTSG
jgi:hypothetical protein